MRHLSTTERYVYLKTEIPRDVFERLLERHRGHVPYLLRELRLKWQEIIEREQGMSRLS